MRFPPNPYSEHYVPGDDGEQCACCRRVFPSLSEFICSECRDSGAMRCPDCREWHIPSDDSEGLVVDGRLVAVVCGRCAMQDHHYRCSFCSETRGYMARATLGTEPVWVCDCCLQAFETTNPANWG